MNSIELYDILTLEDDKEYTVANMILHKDVEYLYLVEVDKDENIIETNQKIVRRIITDGMDGVEIVTDKEELEEVSEIFHDLFAKMVKEEKE